MFIYTYMYIIRANIHCFIDSLLPISLGVPKSPASSAQHTLVVSDLIPHQPPTRESYPDVERPSVQDKDSSRPIPNASALRG